MNFPLERLLNFFFIYLFRVKHSAERIYSAIDDLLELSKSDGLVRVYFNFTSEFVGIAKKHPKYTSDFDVPYPIRNTSNFWIVSVSPSSLCFLFLVPSTSTDTPNQWFMQ